MEVVYIKRKIFILKICGGKETIVDYHSGQNVGEEYVHLISAC